MTFRALCDLADWSDSNTVPTNSPPISHEASNQESPLPQQVQAKTKQPVSTNAKMNLHYNIQIHLPETTNMAVYDAIFQSLKKHLL